jgi:hypothetical protein
MPLFEPLRTVRIGFLRTRDASELEPENRQIGKRYVRIGALRSVRSAKDTSEPKENMRLDPQKQLNVRSVRNQQSTKLPLFGPVRIVRIAVLTVLRGSKISNLTVLRGSKMSNLTVLRGSEKLF